MSLDSDIVLDGRVNTYIREVEFITSKLALFFKIEKKHLIIPKIQKGKKECNLPCARQRIQNKSKTIRLNFPKNQL